MRVKESDNAARLRRFCQVATINDENVLEQTIDWLIPVVMYYSQGPWRGPADWSEEFNAEFSLDIGLHDIGDSLIRLTDSKDLVFSTYEQTYSLSNPCRSNLEKKLSEADDLENRVIAKWLEDVEALVQDVNATELKSLLLDYAGATFRAHGTAALGLLTGQDEGNIDSADNLGRLIECAAEYGISRVDVGPLSVAIGMFFQSSDEETVRYISELADSTFNLLAVASDENVRAELAMELPQIRVFLDTNVALALIGAQDTGMALASADIVREIAENELPIKLYCHAETYKELNRTLDAILGRLCSKPSYPRGLSQAIVKLPWRESRISSIELEYHRKNAKSEISPGTYSTLFSSPMVFLNASKIAIYREPDAKNSEERLILRSTLVEKYKEFLSTDPRRKNAKYETLDHDVRLWLAAADLQTPSRSRKSTLHAGSLILSADSKFAKFDRTVLRHDRGIRQSVVVMPDSLLQALRPFTSRGLLDDRAFARMFATSEFRALHNNSYARVLARVTQYLAVFDGISEEQATKILTDSILMDKLSKLQDEKEFQSLVENALIEEANNAIAALEDATKAGLQLKEALQRRESGDIGEDEFLKQINLYIQYVPGGNVSNFTNNNSNIAAQGDNASISGSVDQWQQNNASVDPALAEDLKKLKEALLTRGGSADFAAVSGVQEAIEAVPSDNSAAVESSLRRAGSRALEVAKSIGVPVAIAAIEAALRL